VKEAINQYRQNGKFYYADPNSINQSIFVIKMIELAWTIGGQVGVYFFLYAVDLLVLFVQFKFLDKIWSRKKNVTEEE